MEQIDLVRQAYKTLTGADAELVEILPPSGSSRIYFRIHNGQNSMIASLSGNPKETESFQYLSDHFIKHQIPVPEVFFVSDDKTLYLQEDLGQLSLLDFLNKEREGSSVPDRVLDLYKEALSGLAKMQIQASTDLDYSRILQNRVFDRQMVKWDLNYFKYSFLNPLGIKYNEEDLEDAFEELANIVVNEKNHFFLYRDFQARNIMIRQEKPWFIDFQGGMRGPLWYDVASLLYQARAALPETIRTQLFEYYLKEISREIDVDHSHAREVFRIFALLRCLQTLGAYGLRGLVQGKGHFLKSIQPAILSSILPLVEGPDLNLTSSVLPDLLKQLADPKTLNPFIYLNKESQSGKLTVRIQSFSYKRAVPQDPSGNGGGFVFDCRAIHNPGRYAPYRSLTGKDQEVIDFLISKTKMPDFLEHVSSIVEESVQVYQSRGFEHLSVSFGCTGGQHRSVYAAEQLAARLKKIENLDVILTHIEQEIKNWQN